MLMLCSVHEWHTWSPPSVASAPSAACPADGAASPPWSAPAAGSPCQALVVIQGKAKKDAAARQLQGTFKEHVHLGVRQCRLRDSQGRAAGQPIWELTSQHGRCGAPGSACCACGCKQCAGAGPSPSGPSAGSAKTSMSSSVSVSMLSLPCQLKDMASTSSLQASASLSEHRLSVLAP